VIKSKYNTAVSLYTVLITAGTRNAQANPTLAAGDVQISKDGGAFANLATLPDALPAAGVQVRLQLSATEMTCKIATIRFKDQTAPAEWDEQYVQVFSYGNASAFEVFDSSQATPAVNATQLAGQTITAAAGVTFPTSVASPTNITAGTITTVTNLTNAPTAGDFTATMKTSIGTAMTTQGYTTTRAGYLDTLNGLVAAIWASATRTLTSFGTLTTDAAAAVWAYATRTLTSVSGLTANANVVSIDGQLTNGNNATLNLKRLNIRCNDGNPALDIRSLASSAPAVNIVGDGSGQGVIIYGGDTGAGIYVSGGATSGHALELRSPTIGSGVVISGNNGPGMTVESFLSDAISIAGAVRGIFIDSVSSGIHIASDGMGIQVVAGGSNAGIDVTGGSGGPGVVLRTTGSHALSLQGATVGLYATGSAHGVYFEGTGADGHGMTLDKNGTGFDLNFVHGSCTVPATSVVLNDVGITQAGADKVWATTVRTLTSFGTLVADTTTAIWGAGTRTLTSFGTLVADVATAVWSAVSRTLTSTLYTPADIWAHTGRSLDTTVDADVVSVAGEVTAATLLSLSARTMAEDEVNDDDFLPTTEEFEVATIVDADLSHWRDRWVIFTSGPLTKQARLIKNYNIGTGGKGHFVCDAFTQEPASTDRFIIV
jgi:hypothetical protein